MAETPAQHGAEAAGADTRGGPDADVREGILRYLRRHPQASDTPTGICTWWLPAEGIYRTEVQVKAVLEGLVADAVLERIALGDAVLYRRAPQAGG